MLVHGAHHRCALAFEVGDNAGILPHGVRLDFTHFELTGYCPFFRDGGVSLDGHVLAGVGRRGRGVNAPAIRERSAVSAHNINGDDGWNNERSSG